MAGNREDLKEWKTDSKLADYSLKNLIKLTLVLKISVIGLIYLGHFLFPFNLPNYLSNFVYPTGENPNLWTPLKTWDGQIYLFLADHGYAPHQFINAFYPLFPFLIRVAGSWLGGRNLLGGLLISHLFTVLAMVYLYWITREKYGERTAFYGCLFLLVFPMGFYLGLLYSESLFLLLAVAYFYYWGQKRYGLTALCAFLMPLTRPTGILVLLPALIALGEGGIKKRSISAKWFTLVSFLAGFLFYFLAMRMMTGDAFSAFESEKYFIAHFNIKNLFHPVDWFARNFININPANSIGPILLFNRAFFLLFLWALAISRKHLSKSFFAYSLVLGLIPALSGGLVTYMRYLLVLFPLFPSLALKWKGKEGYYLFVSLVLQAYFAVQYSLNQFVS